MKENFKFRKIHRRDSSILDIMGPQDNNKINVKEWHIILNSETCITEIWANVVILGPYKNQNRYISQ